MAKRLLLFLGMIVASIGTQAVAQSGGFPCDAFKVQPNRRLEVVRPVTITGPNGKMTLNPGISFGPEPEKLSLDRDFQHPTCRNVGEVLVEEGGFAGCVKTETVEMRLE
jgi:hypothetical protein